MVDFELERVVNRSWMTAMLVGTATNNPKGFPKSPGDLLGQFKPKPPMTPGQWTAMIKMLVAAGGSAATPPKPNKKKKSGS